MIIIPGQLIALLTFPGVIMHEISHRFMCDILHIPVYEVHYFAIGSSRAGYVHHRATDNIYHSLLIGFAPLFINSLFCMIFTLPFSSMLYISGDSENIIISLFLWWIGISMGANAFPSNQDVNNTLTLAKKNNHSFFVKLLCYFIKLLNLFSFVWIDFIFAFAISFILPIALLR